MGEVPEGSIAERFGFRNFSGKLLQGSASSDDHVKPHSNSTPLTLTSFLISTYCDESPMKKGNGVMLRMKIRFKHLCLPVLKDGFELEAPDIGTADAVKFIVRQHQYPSILSHLSSKARALESRYHLVLS